MDGGWSLLAARWSSLEDLSAVVSVFVDALVTRLTGPRCFRVGSCHMWADSEQELHEMAKKIGLKKSWFQNHEKLPHYDLTPRRRLLAIYNGAEQRSLKEYLKGKRDGANRN
jgi:hypothetical protein